MYLIKTNHVLAEDEKANDDTALVPVVTVDSLLPNGFPVLVKIDVEGYEDEVLAGACETIQKYRPFIIIELMDQSEDLIKKRDATIRQLESMGYTLTKLWGWDWVADPSHPGQTR